MTGDRGGRLVQQQELGLERERLGDLDDLHLRYRERRHLGPRIDGAVEQVEDCARLPVHLRIVDHAVSGRQVLEQDVLADRKARDEIALLMDGADRGGERVARAKRIPPAGRRATDVRSWACRRRSRS